MKNKIFAGLLVVLTVLNQGCSVKDNHDHVSGKIIVLTFDDAVKSHLTFVAPCLKELGFGATFFVCHEWMDDTANFLSWPEIAMIHQMGFEIGNHAWNHIFFAQPKAAASLEGELGLVNWELMRVGVPKPVSFAWDGNAFGPESVKVLENSGIKYARRGMQPEIPYGSLLPGPVYRPDKNHPLLIPTTRDAYPGMKLSDFKLAVNQAGENEIVVLQFHGVPDPVHPWVSTTQDDFKKYMQYLKENHFHVIALRDIASFLPPVLPADTLLSFRYDPAEKGKLELPDEMIASRSDIGFWLRDMSRFNYSMEEMMQVTGYDLPTLEKMLDTLKGRFETTKTDKILVLPYPGGRHPRIHFRDGMLSPMRGTKAGIFLPWNPKDYVVLDLPEAILSQFGITFLGHKHIPTVYDRQKIKIANKDWEILSDGGLKNEWRLPGNIIIGTEVHPGVKDVKMKLSLTNNSKDTLLTDLQTQVCIMLKAAGNFEALTNDNKIFNNPYAAAEDIEGKHRIITAWDRCSHAWGNSDCPCMHADPKLNDCAPGETVSVTGEIWFYEGSNPEPVFNEALKKYKVVQFKEPRL